MTLVRLRYHLLAHMITGSGLGNNKLPVVHRQSPCSPLHGLPSLTAADVLRRDASLIRRRFSSQSSLVAAPAPSPAGTIIPADGSSDPATLPGALDYIVLVSYGTPEQQFPVLLDTSIGASLLRCKPCASGSDSCDPAFDTSPSSTFAHVPCGSPDCPANCSGGSACLFDDPYSRIEGTFTQDVLTLAPSMAVHDFRFVCLDVDEPSYDMPEAGTLDLSRDRNSLPSRLSSSWLVPGASFSYCLPPLRASSTLAATPSSEKTSSPCKPRWCGTTTPS
ncbi:aspartyl protease AED1-like [Miscanthus floridulus]|uniref:aspartyl protease AED1-like n=1 Tax=Miscanthus floridulus TaxID=154761 RepID=UPI003457F3D4